MTTNHTGDKTAKTKPSKHTKKFKKMFGELYNELKTKVESTDIGNDYYKHTSTITPNNQIIQVLKTLLTNHQNQVVVITLKLKELKVSWIESEKKPSEKDIKEWASWSPQ